MATLTFAYNHSRDPMNSDDLADKIATALTLTSQPDVAITNAVQTPANSILVTHPNITSGNTAAIQTIINAYVLDPVRASFGSGNLGALRAKAQQAITTNNTFLAIPSPTTAQTLAQVQRLTREATALIKLALNDNTDTAGT